MSQLKYSGRAWREKPTETEKKDGVLAIPSLPFFLSLSFLSLSLSFLSYTKGEWGPKESDLQELGAPNARITAANLSVLFAKHSTISTERITRSAFSATGQNRLRAARGLLHSLTLEPVPRRIPLSELFTELLAMATQKRVLVPVAGPCRSHRLCISF